MRRHYFDSLYTRDLALDSGRKKLGGVCAGVSRYLDAPSIFVRIIAIGSLCVAPQATLIAYGLAYLILDDDPGDETYEDR
ncbi:MAG TPA: PspC domain-containing protein [Pseudomonadales bacterium]|jgi:phage shock protein PspC (stress-responsive transcriptional regulator)|nr:PspC domain-containing protein [Pseudomonadales bacterium]|tara:strand:- start:4034 stop:4273 length:240 start_codon:yes stop_codon:yes gene_type:complete